MKNNDTLSIRRSKLSGVKKALLEKFLVGDFSSSATTDQIARRPDSAAPPLSFSQLRLWFLDSLAPFNPAYNLSSAVRLSGSLHLEALNRALSAIIDRHEALRTAIAIIDDQPVQLIAPHLDFHLPLIDLSDRPLSEAVAEARTLASAETLLAFNLYEAPLLRARLIRLAPDDHLLLMTFHHIICDGWSIDIFVGELASLYDAFVLDKPSMLPELTIQYADFAHWQRSLLEGERMTELLGFWKQQLEQAPAVLELPTDYPRPAMLSFKGASLNFTIARPLADSVKALSAAQGASLFMTLMATFNLLLSRYSAQRDILVGTPIANRNRVELEPVFGFFANTLVLRTDLGGKPAFEELLQRVKETALAAYAHQDMPFEKLVEELRPERDLSHSPLFQVMFVLQNTPLQQFKLSGLTLAHFPVEDTTAKFELWLSLSDSGDELSAVLEYSTDLFEAATIDRMAGHFLALLEEAAAAPHRPISEFGMLTSAERRQLLVEWNSTDEHYSGPNSLAARMEAEGERSPHSVAVVFRQQQLTYQELNHRANQLARLLKEKGVGPDEIVAVCIERSAEMIISLLAVLKAGGAYLPLDPDLPRPRIAFMLSDADPKAIITIERLRALLPEQTGGVICLDEQQIIESHSGDRLPPEIAGDNLAYVIYTSGSTGKPKGAMISQRGICNRLDWMQQQFNLTPDDAVLQKTPYSFDVSVWELFWPLMNGATLVMAEPGGHKDAQYLMQLIDEQQVTLLHFVPSMLQAFLQEADEGSCRSLRRVICSGEALEAQTVQRFYEKMGAELYNLYGPTEASVDVTCWRCEPAADSRSVPIGRPIANLRMYILDEAMQVVPVGVAGELRIAGLGVARGYLKRADLTAEKFIPDEWSREAGGRLYRSGDLARYLKDGSIEFLGRIDDQVKIRGYRIELGEIEAVLSLHPSLIGATVLAREDESARKRLVAYIVPQADRSADGGNASASQLHAEQVSEWQLVFDDTYQQVAPHADPTFNTAGWNSSFDGLPIPAAEMEEWVTRTVDSILALAPRRVLEIGCGTGLLLFPLARHCQQYIGTDFSVTALRDLRGKLKAIEPRLPQVTLLERSADDFTGIEAGAFNTVILNSVVQYFPSLDYLLRVLERAAAAVEPGGRIFVGDVRSLPLLETLHTSVELHSAPDSLSTEKLMRRVSKRIAQDIELIIDPEFFAVLNQHLPQISHVQILLKRGSYRNELSRYRYDVILHVGHHGEPPAGCAWRDWQTEGFSTAVLRELLSKSAPAILACERVPNARLLGDVLTLQLLKDEQRPETVGELKAMAAGLSLEEQVDPEALWRIGDELGYKVEITWSASREDDCYDVIFARNSAPVSVAGVARSASEKTLTARPLRSYANNPLAEKLAQKLVPEVRSYLKDRLPDYMVPSAFVMMDSLPLTANGKVDRKALPPPAQAAPEMEANFVAPRTPVEEGLAEVWASVLSLDRVGVNNNFFELGGDSIHTIQVVARANQVGLRFTTRQMFQHQTIAELAEVVAVDSQVEVEQDLVLGPVPLTPAQRWLLEESVQGVHLPGQAMLLQIDGPVKPDLLEQAVRQLLIHHDALRTSFSQAGAVWQQVIGAPTEALSIADFDISALSELQQNEFIETQATEMRRSLHSSAGPPLPIAVFHRGDDKPNQLLFVAHRLVADYPSWRILLEDFQQAYGQLSQSKPLRLPAKTTSFASWANHLFNGARPELEELSYWLSEPRSRVGRLPVERAKASEEQSAQTVIVSLNASETGALLGDVHSAYNTRTSDLLLAALALAISGWSGQRTVIVDLEGDGRRGRVKEADLSRTVGFFTTVFPALLDLTEAFATDDVIKAVKEQLRLIPNDGAGYGLLRYRSDGDAVAKSLGALPQAELSFNYIDRFDQAAEMPAFSTVRAFFEPEPSPPASSPYLMQVNAGVVDGQLRIAWTYCADLLARSTVEHVAQTFIGELEKIIAHCQSPGAGGSTPSDFRLAKLTQRKLDELARLYPQIADLYPLTPMQQHMLFHRLYRSESGLYTIHITDPVNTEVDVRAFEQAWQHLLDRHPVLRTAFVWEGLDEPLQVVCKHADVPLHQQDLRGQSQDEQEEILETYITELRRRSFDLTQAPHMRVALFRMGDKSYRYVWCFNYMLQDGWSFPIFMKEFFTLYEALSQGQRINLPVRRPFRDYIGWLQKQDLGIAEAYWRSTLKGFSKPTPLVAALNPDGMPEVEDRYVKLSTQLSVAISTALRSFARQHQLTLSVLVQGAWALLLCRYTGEEDVVYGLIHSGRPPEISGIEEMVGFFNTILPARASVTPDSPLLPWLRDIQARRVELRQYEYSPPLQIKQWCDVPPELPLFESYLVFENFPVDRSLNQHSKNIGLGVGSSLVQTEHHLRIEVFPAAKIGVSMAYYRRHFESRAITRLLGDLQTLLGAIVSNPHQTPGELLRQIR
jgi:amino acid adenylation domain-containing protein/non-ribosomal peptide synthase protein (TIGR01720 family)